MEDPIFCHEDFYRQVELVPEENYFKTLRDISTIPNTDNKSEYGFNTAIERGEQKIKTEDLNIHIASVQEALHPFIIKQFKKVTTGYGTSVDIKQNTIALGFERLALFFELNHKSIVKNIWVCQSTVLPKINNPEKLLNALLVLGTHFKLILVDWNEEASVRLINEKNVRDYLKQTFAFNFLSQ